jgi:hypothetical protein
MPGSIELPVLVAMFVFALLAFVRSGASRGRR